MTRARRVQVLLLAAAFAPSTAADLWAAQKNIQLVRAVTANASGQLEFAKQVSGHGAGLAGLERGAVLDAPYEQSFKTGFQGGGSGAVSLPWVPAEGARPGASVPPGSTGPSAAQPVFTPGEDVTPWKSNLDRVGELRKQGYLWLGLALGLVAMAVPLLLLPLPWTKAAGLALLGAAFAAFLQARMQFQNAKDAARELKEVYAQADQARKADDQISEEVQAAEEHREPGKPAEELPDEAVLAAGGADQGGLGASTEEAAGGGAAEPPRTRLASAGFSPLPQPAPSPSAGPDPKDFTEGRGIEYNSAEEARERLEILEKAEDMLGIPYVYGGNSRRGMDCSAWLSAVWGIPRRTTWTIYDYAYKISKDDLKPGDALNLTSNRSEEGYGHIRLFAGWANKEHTEMWVYEEASSYGKAVKRKTHWSSVYQPIRRKDLPRK